MAGWRAVDQEPVASRQAIAAGLAEVAGIIATLTHGGSAPTIIASWQDAAYLDRPSGLLDRLARLGHTIVACAGPVRHGEHGHVPLDADTVECDEWSLVALTPERGIVFVAHEVGASLPSTSIDGGRAYRYDVTDDPRVVVAHARRLQRSFGARMAPDDAARVAEAITALTALADAVTTAEDDDAIARVVEAVEHADAARRNATMDPARSGGLVALADWLGDAGPRSPDLGMIVVRSASRGVTAALRENLHTIGRLGDLVVAVPPDAAMIVLPGLTFPALEDRAQDITALLCEQLATGDVQAIAVEVPAVQARRDLVGSLGQALAALRETTSSQRR